MRVHFIAIGGSAMHNLAIALHKKGFQVTGSDDEIFEPSKGRLVAHGLLPEAFGWYPDKLTSDIEAIILGMHAREDNPELIRAREMGLKIYSYPEYLYEQTKDKIRVVIGGSHGKTTTTAMVMHVLRYLDMDFDYMVGAQLEGFDTMVKLTKEAPIAVFEGDEYLSSPIDMRPKFHWYKPQVAMLTGIAWDHINVFPTFENYVDQFKIFMDKMPEDGKLIWFDGDEHIAKLIDNVSSSKTCISYNTHPNAIRDGKTYLTTKNGDVALDVFGEHNLQNMNGARLVCHQIGVSDSDFYAAIQSFGGAAKRLQKLAESDKTAIFLDFAHSPSKLQATTAAVKEQYNNRRLIACMELHTFSSLKADFLPQYNGTMAVADEAIVYFNPEVIKHKRLANITAEQVAKAFGGDNVTVYTDSDKLQTYLRKLDLENKTLLLMSSGNFSGINFKEFAKELIEG